MIARRLVCLGFILSCIALPAAASGPSARTVSASQSRVFPLRWQQGLVRKGTHRAVTLSLGRPAVSARHNLVIIGTAEARLVALSSHDGHEIWSRDFPTEIEFFGAIARHPQGEEVVIFSSRDGKLHCVATDTGQTLWSKSLGAESRAEPQILPAGVLVTTAASEVFLLDLAEGNVVWSKRRTPLGGMTVLGHGRALTHGGSAYVGFADGYVAAFDLKSGKERWATPVSLSHDRFVDVDADPVMIDGQLIVASHQSGVVALDPTSGRILWRQPGAGVNRLAGDGKRLFAANGSGYIWRLNPSNGSVVYRVRVEEGPVSRMLLKGNLLTFAGGPNGLVVLDAVNGRPLQATALRGGANSGPNWSDLGIFVLGNRGDLYAFDIR